MTELTRRADAYRKAETATASKRAELYQAIRDAAAAGRSMRSIAAEVGMTAGRVHQIVHGN